MNRTRLQHEPMIQRHRLNDHASTCKKPQVTVGKLLLHDNYFEINHPQAKMILRSLWSPVTKSHVERRIIETHPLHLFRIIQDVDQYSSFLPLCQFSKVLKRAPDGRSFEGKLIVGKPPLFSEEYVSRVSVIPEELTIRTRSIESKNFDLLTSRWTLGEVPASKDSPTTDTTYQCEVDFEVEMTVSDPLIVSVLDQILEQVAGRQVEAFSKRCEEIPISFDLIDAAERLKQRQQLSDVNHSQKRR